MFGVYNGYNRLIVAPHADTFPGPGRGPQHTSQVDGEELLAFNTDALLFA